MARKRSRIPSCVHHKPSGQARVRIDGRDIYLGKWGTPEAEESYKRVVAEWLQSGIIPEAEAPKHGQNEGSRQGSPLTISELILAFFTRHVQDYYVKNGRPTGEQCCFRSALRPLKELYGSLPVDEFSPLKLKAVREQYVKKGWVRGYVNKSVSRVRLMFRWGVENEMVAAATLQALDAVQGLRKGRTEARDNPKRKPVPQEHVDAVKAVVRQRTRDMIDLQLLTGARPGELVMLTTAMIDKAADVWLAWLDDHKTVEHDKERVLVFGPQAQMILRRHLREDQPDERLFQLRRDSYGATVAKACQRAGVPRFTPHWLRHTAATRLREEHGLEATQVMLGHSRADMTQLYAQKNVRAAVEVARKVG